MSSLKMWMQKIFTSYVTHTNTHTQKKTHILTFCVVCFFEDRKRKGNVTERQTCICWGRKKNRELWTLQRSCSTYLFLFRLSSVHSFLSIYSCVYSKDNKGVCLSFFSVCVCICRAFAFSLVLIFFLAFEVNKYVICALVLFLGYR